MTRSSVLNKAKSLRSLTLLIATITIGVCFSGEISEYIFEGMELAVSCVIPSSFPFMIIADFYTHYGSPEQLWIIGDMICKLVGIKPYMLSTFICGNVGGFPIGAKMAADLYSVNGCDKDELERLIPLSSNPSVAFVIGGVGLGMYNDATVGSILLASIFLSMLLCAIITRPNESKNSFSLDISKQKYNFVSSVKQSGASCISLISFISIFSAAVGIIKNHIKNEVVSYSFITILEVTNAVKIFSASNRIPLPISTALSGFTLGFGGLSVMMQSAALLLGSDLGMKKYLFIKLLQGVFCGAIASVLCLLIM